MLSSPYPLFAGAEMSHYTREPHVTTRDRQICGGGEEVASWEAVPAWTGRLGLPEITTGGVRNHNHIVLVMLGHCSLAHSHSLLQKQ